MLELLKRPELTYSDLTKVREGPSIRPDAALQVEIESKYEGYIARQEQEIQRLSGQVETVIPDTFEYGVISGLSNELQTKLNEVRPVNLDQASRIPGMTPAALSLLVIYLKKQATAGIMQQSA
jgi:tRNA uridine 5-carboxymethylaminomethyl modification enzyme